LRCSYEVKPNYSSTNQPVNSLIVALLTGGNRGTNCKAAGIISTVEGENIFRCYLLCMARELPFGDGTESHEIHNQSQNSRDVRKIAALGVAIRRHEVPLGW